MVAIGISVRLVSGLTCAAVGLPQDVSGFVTLASIALFVSMGPFAIENGSMTNLASIAAMRQMSFGFRPTRSFELPDWSAQARGAVVRVHFMMLIVFGVLISAAFLGESYAFPAISVLLTAFTILMATTVKIARRKQNPRQGHHSGVA